MTRFEKELSGQLGAYWKASAEKELAAVKADLEAGKITIDEQGIARNCIGRVLMNDMLEKLTMVSGKVSVENTQAARDAETRKTIEAYRKADHQPSEEELWEMRAAFGRGTTVVDAITGRKTRL